MDPKISIVTSYLNRKAQFLKTIEILEKHPLKKEFELIVVDDASEEQHRLDLDDCLDTSFETTLIRVEPEHKNYKNPCVAYNLAASYARGEKIILQNPECIHAGDLITPTLQLQEGDFLSFHCYSFGIDSTNAFLSKDLSNLSFGEVCSQTMQAISALPQNSVDVTWPDRGESWFNHASYRPVGFHFAAAINTKDWKDLNGFDNRFADGIGWDDTEFILRVRRKLNLKFCSATVVHLFHQEFNFTGHDSMDLYKKNEELYKQVLNSGEWRAPDISKYKK